MLVAEIVQRAGRDGLRATFRKAVRYLRTGCAADDFDRRNGTNTGKIEPLWKLAIDSPNLRFGVRYQPTGEDELKEALNFLHEDLRRFIFIDLGCGKGRALLVAYNLGFKQVIGVEFARELADIARTNLAKLRISNARVMHADAGGFKFPDSDMVVYLYNPFSNQVMGSVIANLSRCRSRRRYVIYNNPVCAKALDSSGFLRRLGPLPGREDIQIWKTA